jgi:hypothetical protein
VTLGVTVPVPVPSERSKLKRSVLSRRQPARWRATARSCQLERRPVAAAADEHACEVAGLAGGHEPNLPAAVGDGGAARVAAARPVAEAYGDAAVERRAQRDADEGARRRGDRLDLADVLAALRRGRGRRGQREQKHEQREGDGTGHTATLLDPVRCRQDAFEVRVLRPRR